MSQYKTLLWDVDGTLLDFSSAEQKGILQVFERHGFSIDNTYLNRYQQINSELWNLYEEGKIKKEEIFNSRFQKLLGEMNIQADGIIFEKEYREELDKNHDLIPGALEICNDLYKKYDMYIVTNGLSKTQHRRLRESGLNQYFKEIFVSEEIGHQKPSIEFFQYCFKNISNKDMSTMLIIGDSLSSDMQGGINAGIDTCWYNPGNETNGNKIRVTYIIDELEKIKKVLL